MTHDQILKNIQTLLYSEAQDSSDYLQILDMIIFAKVFETFTINEYTYYLVVYNKKITTPLLFIFKTISKETVLSVRALPKSIKLVLLRKELLNFNKAISRIKMIDSDINTFPGVDISTHTDWWESVLEKYATILEQLAKQYMCEIEDNAKIMAETK